MNLHALFSGARQNSPITKLFKRDRGVWGINFESNFNIKGGAFRGLDTSGKE